MNVPFSPLPPHGVWCSCRCLWLLPAPSYTAALLWTRPLFLQGNQRELGIELADACWQEGERGEPGILDSLCDPYFLPYPPHSTQLISSWNRFIYIFQNILAMLSSFGPVSKCFLSFCLKRNMRLVPIKKQESIMDIQLPSSYPESEQTAWLIFPRNTTMRSSCLLPSHSEYSWIGFLCSQRVFFFFEKPSAC